MFHKRVSRILVRRAWLGACMPYGHVWPGWCAWQGGNAWQGGMCGKGHVWHGGMCGKGHVWHGGMCGRGHVWQGACVAGGMAGGVAEGMHGGARMAGETVTAMTVCILLECILARIWVVVVAISAIFNSFEILNMLTTIHSFSSKQ